MDDKKAVIVCSSDGVCTDLPTAFAWDILCEEKAIEPVLRFGYYRKGNLPEILLNDYRSSDERIKRES